MGFRFRRSVKLLPGVRLNFSTRGVSTSIGGRGATVNLGRRGGRVTLGVPGTGLSYTTPLSAVRRKVMLQSAGSPVVGWIVIGVVLLLLATCVSGLKSTPMTPVEAQPPASATPAIQLRTVTGDGVHCRASASMAAAVLGKLGKGDSVSVLEPGPEWTRIVHPGGDCWVANDFLAH